MKPLQFRLSSLIWAATLVAFLLGLVSMVRERRVYRGELAAVLRQAQDAEHQRREALDLVESYRRRLGLLPSTRDPAVPWVRYITLPAELGGDAGQRLPLILRWRLAVPARENFVICATLSEVPAGRGDFRIPEQSIRRLRPFAGDGRNALPAGGRSAPGKNPGGMAGNRTIEILLTLRLDSTASGVDFDLNARIFLDSHSRQLGYDWFAPKTGHEWFAEPGLTHIHRTIKGPGIESVYLPDLDQAISFDEPLTLVHLRGKRWTGDGKFEAVDGPGPGLMVWLDACPELAPE